MLAGIDSAIALVLAAFRKRKTQTEGNEANEEGEQRLKRWKIPKVEVEALPRNVVELVGLKVLNLDAMLQRAVAIDAGRSGPQGCVEDDGDASDVHGSCPDGLATDLGELVSERRAAGSTVSH
jgi:hypothetical protein